MVGWIAFLCESYKDSAFVAKEQRSPQGRLQDGV